MVSQSASPMALESVLPTVCLTAADRLWQQIAAKLDIEPEQR